MCTVPFKNNVYLQSVRLQTYIYIYIYIYMSLLSCPDDILDIFGIPCLGHVSNEVGKRKKIIIRPIYPSWLVRDISRVMIIIIKKVSTTGWIIMARKQCIRINHHHHHIVLVARISLTLSRHSSLSFIALGRSSGQHPVSSHSCWMYVRAGRPAFARPWNKFIPFAFE